MFAAEIWSGLSESACEVEGQVSDGVENAGGVAGAGAVGVVAQADVQNVEGAVLDVPAATEVIQQTRGVGLGSRQTGDGVSRALADRAVGQLGVAV